MVSLCACYLWKDLQLQLFFLRNCYYLFDSHSRDERDLSVVDTTSVLMKFRDLYELEKCLQVAYLKYRDRQQAYFQLQFVNELMAREVIVEIQPVFNHYKAVTYMCAYLSKYENECSMFGI